MTFRRTGVRMAVLVLGIVAFASVALAQEKYDALVVEGPKLNGSSSRSVKAILESHLGLKVGVLRLENLGRVDFTGVKLLYFPGADYLHVRLPEDAGINVRKAVAGGMGYIGTCGGSLVASRWAGMPDGRGGHWASLALFPGRQTFQSGKGMRRYYFEVDHPIVARSSVAKEITPVFQIDYNGGPGNYILNPEAREGFVHWVVGWQADKKTDEKTDRPGLVAILYGRGRVFLTTSHPERPRIPQTHCVIKMAAEWCVGKSDPEKNALPTVVLKGPEQGSVEEDLVYSAVGSDDPDGFPIGFIWDFGDGTPPVYTPEETHLYTRPGTYTVTLTVTDGKDETVRTQKVTIRERKRRRERPQTAKTPDVEQGGVGLDTSGESDER